MKTERQAIETIRRTLNACGITKQHAPALAALDLLTAALDRTEQVEKALHEVGKRLDYIEKCLRVDRPKEVARPDTALVQIGKVRKAWSALGGETG